MPTLGVLCSGTLRRTKPYTGQAPNPTPGDGDNPTPGDGDNPTPGAGDNPTPDDGDNPTPGDADNPTPGDGDNPAPSQAPSDADNPTYSQISNPTDPPPYIYDYDKLRTSKDTSISFQAKTMNIASERSLLNLDVYKQRGLELAEAIRNDPEIEVSRHPGLEEVRGFRLRSEHDGIQPHRHHLKPAGNELFSLLILPKHESQHGYEHSVTASGVLKRLEIKGPAKRKRSTPASGPYCPSKFIEQDATKIKPVEEDASEHTHVDVRTDEMYWFGEPDDIPDLEYGKPTPKRRAFSGIEHKGLGTAHKHCEALNKWADTPVDAFAEDMGNRDTLQKRGSLAAGAAQLLQQVGLYAVIYRVRHFIIRDHLSVIFVRFDLDLQKGMSVSSLWKQNLKDVAIALKAVVLEKEVPDEEKPGQFKGAVRANSQDAQFQQAIELAWHHEAVCTIVLDCDHLDVSDRVWYAYVVEDRDTTGA